MLRIENFNTSANLVYLENYLTENFDFQYLMIEVNCLCLQFNTEPTGAEKTQILNYYNNIEEVDWLESYKLQRFAEINERTAELIESGYTYKGFNFSLSDRAQTNILALYSALATKKSYLDSGTVLKEQIRAATTQAEVDIINDIR